MCHVKQLERHAARHMKQGANPAGRRAKKKRIPMPLMLCWPAPHAVHVPAHRAEFSFRSEYIGRQFSLMRRTMPAASSLAFGPSF